MQSEGSKVTRIQRWFPALPLTNFASCNPKSVHYLSDGTGRDNYIAVNSGGLIVSKETKTAFAIGKSYCYLGTFQSGSLYKSRWPAIDSRSVYYHSDGTGRDSYIG